MSSVAAAATSPLLRGRRLSAARTMSKRKTATVDASKAAAAAVVAEEEVRVAAPARRRCSLERIVAECERRSERPLVSADILAQLLKIQASKYKFNASKIEFLRRVTMCWLCLQSTWMNTRACARAASDTSFTSLITTGTRSWQTSAASCKS